jgi:hypothetical protein
MILSWVIAVIGLSFFSCSEFPTHRGFSNSRFLDHVDHTDSGTGWSTIHAFHMQIFNLLSNRIEQGYALSR